MYETAVKDERRANRYRRLLASPRGLPLIGERDCQAHAVHKPREILRMCRQFDCPEISQQVLAPIAPIAKSDPWAVIHKASDNEDVELAPIGIRHPKTGTIQ